MDMPRLSQHCEVPEIKHACLGGVYALKNAVRHCLLEDSAAIVICSDLALYARGSSGEPTQGAGAVALLVERTPAPCQPGAAARGTRLRLPGLRLPQASHGRRPAAALQPALSGVQWPFFDLLLSGPGPQRALAPLPAPGGVGGGMAAGTAGGVLSPSLPAHAAKRLCTGSIVRRGGSVAPIAHACCNGFALKPELQLDEALDEMRGRQESPDHNAGGESAWNPFPRTNELMKGLRAIPEFDGAGVAFPSAGETTA